MKQYPEPPIKYPAKLIWHRIKESLFFVGCLLVLGITVPVIWYAVIDLMR